MNRCYSSLDSVASGMPQGMAGLHLANHGIGFMAAAAAPAIAATGPAAPFIMAATALMGPIIKLVTNAFKGCGQTCVQATQYANQAEQALVQLNSQYNALPVHYRSAQQHALQLIDQVFQALHDSCSNPALGPAGQRCISERLVKGGTAPWCPKPNHVGCDWITLYRDPIANDTSVVDDPPTALVSSGNAVASAVGGSVNLPVVGNVPILLLAGIGLLLFSAFSSDSPRGGRRYQ